MARAKAKERRFGVEIEHGNIKGWEYVADKLYRKFPRWCNTGSDGSGVEARSPILQGQSGYDELGEVMEYLQEIGGFISASDGLHIHHDAADIVTNVHAIHKIQESYMLNQTVIDKLVDPYRKKWQALDPTRFDEHKRVGRIATGRHNVHFVPRHGTIEFRQHEGTLNPARALAWVEFGQRFIDNVVYGRKKPLACVDSPDLLLRRLGCADSVIQQLTKRGSSTKLLKYNIAHDLAVKGRNAETLH